MGGITIIFAIQFANDTFLFSDFSAFDILRGDDDFYELFRKSFVRFRSELRAHDFVV